MATTRAGMALTEAHRIGQTRIAADLVRRLLTAWPLLDLSDLDGTAPRWLDVSEALVTASHGQSAALGAAYYAEHRRAEIGTMADMPTVGPPTLTLDALRTSLLVTGPIAVKSGQSLDDAAAGSAGAASRHALSGGRDAIRARTAADRRTVGARRVTAPGCCAFCAMLAIRSLDGLSSDATSTGMDAYRVHDNCRCVPEPAYSADGQIVTAELERLRQVYRASADAVSGDGRLAAFRRALSAQA